MPITFLISMLPAVLLILCATQGWAQSYPSKVVRYLVPYEAGGGNDVMARIMAAGLSQAWGQQVVVENRPGAGGNIGTELAARAPTDGYTLLQISATNAVNASLYRHLRYDLVRDFAPVTLFSEVPFVLMVHPSVKAATVQELIALAKSQPGKLHFGSSGQASQAAKAAARAPPLAPTCLTFERS